MVTSTDGWLPRALRLFFRLNNDLIDLPASSRKAMRAARVLPSLVAAIERVRS